MTRSSTEFTPSYIITYTGKKVYPTALQISDVDKRDVAYSLAGQRRWLAHSRRLINTAVHSIFVALIVRDFYQGGAVAQLYALGHDGFEANGGDMPKPLKDHSKLGRVYTKVEHRGQAVVEQALFGREMPEQVRKLIHRADKRALAADVVNLMPRRRGVTWAEQLADYNLSRDDLPTPELLRVHRQLTKLSRASSARAWLRWYGQLSRECRYWCTPTASAGLLGIAPTEPMPGFAGRVVFGELTEAA
jgi:5'-deoxynucleotidase YfbR-like HD superfamily hydrolase